MASFETSVNNSIWFSCHLIVLVRFLVRKFEFKRNITSHSFHDNCKNASHNYPLLMIDGNLHSGCKWSHISTNNCDCMFSTCCKWSGNWSVDYYYYCCLMDSKHINKNRSLAREKEWNFPSPQHFHRVRKENDGFIIIITLKYRNFFFTNRFTVRLRWALNILAIDSLIIIIIGKESIRVWRMRIFIEFSNQRPSNQGKPFKGSNV